MEDFPQPDNDKKEKLTKRRRFARTDFLSSWLGLQRQTKTTESHVEEDKEPDIDDEENSKNKLSFSERFFRKLGKVFRGLIAVEPVAVTVASAIETSQSDEVGQTTPNIPETDISPEDQVFDHINVPLGNHTEIIDTPEMGYEEASDNEASQNEPANEADNNFDLAEQIVSADETDNRPNVAASVVETNSGQPVNQVSEKRIDKTDYHGANSQPAVLASEVLRRLQEKKFKKEVNKLKERAQDLETEQRTVKLQQEAFSRQLIRQNKPPTPNILQAPTGVQTKNTLNRQHYNSKPPSYEKISQQNPSIEPIKPQIDVQKTTELKTESPLFTEKFKKLIAKPTETQPDIILQAVEQAAEQNAPIESLYEHRHEIKDSANDDNYIIKKGSVTAGGAYQQQSNKTAKPRTSAAAEANRFEKASQAAGSDVEPNTGNMYRQAVTGGFWTAIILIVMIGSFIIITHFTISH